MILGHTHPFADIKPTPLDLAYEQANGANPLAYEQANVVTHDPVNRPKHYDFGGFQVIDIRDILLDRIQRKEALTYKQADYWSRAWEYMTRFMEKGGHEDLRKAKFYLDRLVESIAKEV